MASPRRYHAIEFYNPNTRGRMQRSSSFQKLNEPLLRFCMCPNKGNQIIEIQVLKQQTSDSLHLSEQLAEPVHTSVP
jgi:hypothetical protein